MVAHDRDAIGDLQHVDNAGHLARGRVLEPGERAAEHRAHRGDRDLHARDLHVDAVDRLAVDLGRRIDPLLRRADQRPVLAVLERRIGGQRQGQRDGHQRGIARGPARRGVLDHSAFDAAPGGIDPPLLRRRLHQHGARDRRSLAQAFPAGTDRCRAARRLQAEQRVGVELVVGRREIRRHLIEPDIEFLRHQHRGACPDPLPHLYVAHDEHDLPVLADPDEGVWRERVRRGGRARHPASHWYPRRHDEGGGGAEKGAAIWSLQVGGRVHLAHRHPLSSRRRA